jgi:hypothetical protein
VSRLSHADADPEPPPPDEPHTATTTWNDQQRIAIHRALSPGERIRLTIEASRAALRFAHGRRIDER